MKSICLFAGYDKDGIIDDYVIYYIKRLAQISDVYYCGDFEPKEGELEKLKKYTKDAIAFRHKKYDYGSWGELIKKIGWQNVQKYDQLILANDSCYGPLFPLEEVFNIMNKKSCDFWGLSCGKGYHIHIQSYFLVFRKKVLESDSINYFLSQVKEQPSLKEVCEYYEDQFTFFLKKRGFSYDSYIPYGEFILHPYYETWKCIKNKRFPLLKVKAFNGEVGYDKVTKWEKFIKKYTEYDPLLISNNLHRRGYKDSEIKLAIRHYERNNILKTEVNNLKNLPKKALKKIINPMWKRYMYKIDKRFLENRYLLEKNINELKNQINKIDKKMEFYNKNEYSPKAKLEIQDFFQKYQLGNDLKLNLEIHKKSIEIPSDADILSDESVISKFKINEFMRTFKNIPMYRKSEKINMLLCGNIYQDNVIEYLLNGSNIALLNNKLLDKKTFEYELIANSNYETCLLSDFCFYQEKDIYFFDLILVNKLKENINEGELLALLYNLGKNMLDDESILIISIPHNAKVMDNFEKILDEANMYWNLEYQEVLENCFADMENSNCLVLGKRVKEEI